MPSGEMSGEDILELYRKRGKAEGDLGELMSVVAQALSSTSRRKSHYQGKKIRKREQGVDPFACDQLRLLLAGFGYQIMHVQRAVLERMTGTPDSSSNSHEPTVPCPDSKWRSVNLGCPRSIRTGRTRSAVTLKLAVG